jgi:hypothetical protein
MNITFIGLSGDGNIFVTLEATSAVVLWLMRNTDKKISSKMI